MEVKGPLRERCVGASNEERNTYNAIFCLGNMSIALFSAILIRERMKGGERQGGWIYG